jgi:hypothetical protein
MEDRTSEARRLSVIRVKNVLSTFPSLVFFIPAFDRQNYCSSTHRPYVQMCRALSSQVLLPRSVCWESASSERTSS